jgi:enolase-phosphatase E1
VSQPPRAVLLDVEGTTTPVDFVVGTLFALARERLGSYLGSHGNDAEVRARVAELRAAWEAEDPAGGRPPWSGPGVRLLAHAPGPQGDGAEGPAGAGLG